MYADAGMGGRARGSTLGSLETEDPASTIDRECAAMQELQQVQEEARQLREKLQEAEAEAAGLQQEIRERDQKIRQLEASSAKTREEVGFAETSVFLLKLRPPTFPSAARACPVSKPLKTLPRCCVPACVFVCSSDTEAQGFLHACTEGQCGGEGCIWGGGSEGGGSPLRAGIGGQ